MSASLQFTRNQLRGFLFVMLTMDALLIGALLWFAASPTVGMIGFACGLLLPFLIFRGLVPVLAGMMGWWTLQRLYPPHGFPPIDPKAPLATIALRKRFLGINNCIEAAADDDHLHLRIFGLIGPPMMPISIPWVAMTSITVPHRTVAAIVLDQGPRMWVPEKLVAREIALRMELESLSTPQGQGAP